MKYKEIAKTRKRIVQNEYLNRWFASLGYNAKSIKNLDSEEHDPMLLDNAYWASEIIENAINDPKAVITIAGDYDADGICGTSILYKGIKYLGKTPNYMIPDRIRDGYGMNKRQIDEAKQVGTTLLITVDNGITCHKEIDYAKQLGMKVVLTDHHNIGETSPHADAIVHPALGSYPFRDISGATVAYKLMRLMIEKQGRNSVEDRAMIDYLRCLAGITVISDVMPLVDENRTIFKKSVEYLKSCKDSALSYLLELAEIDPEHIDETTYGFSICPMINAVGRLSNAEYAVDFLTTNDPKSRRYQGVSMVALNEKRKDMQKRQQAELEPMINNDHGGIVVFNDAFDIHEGLIGIIAGRICQEYKKPTILFTKAESSSGDPIWKASARSTEDCNIYDVLHAMDQEDSDLFLNYGGHAGAAGMSIPFDKKEAFEKLYYEKVSELSTEFEQPYMSVPVDKIEELVEATKPWQPFGQGFPKPVIRFKFNVTNAKLYYRTGSAYLTNGIIDVWEKIPHVVDSIRNHDYRLTFSTYDKFLSNSEQEAAKTEYYRPKNDMLSYDVVCSVSSNYFGGKDTIKADILLFVEK